MGLTSLVIAISCSCIPLPAWQSVKWNGCRPVSGALERAERMRRVIAAAIGANVRQNLQRDRPAKGHAFAAARRAAAAAIRMRQSERHRLRRDLDEARQ